VKDYEFSRAETRYFVNETELHIVTENGFPIDEDSVRENTTRVWITPKAIQDLLDELEASKQSRLRAWNVLQRLSLVLSENGQIAERSDHGIRRSHFNDWKLVETWKALQKSKIPAAADCHRHGGVFVAPGLGASLREAKARNDAPTIISAKHAVLRHKNTSAPEPIAAPICAALIPGA
jgi:hypothetical protein